MDLTAPFKTEVLRPITNWVIPGSIAIAPYILILGFYIRDVMTFLSANGAAAAAIITICALASGLILDNIGASIESAWWDPLLERRYPTHLDDWRRYLKLRIRDEIVAARYLKMLVMKMKFELSMAPALLVFWIGLLWMNVVKPAWGPRGVVFLSVLCVTGVVYFLRESYVSARVCSRVRVSILNAVDEAAAVNALPAAPGPAAAALSPSSP